jgi:proteasome lid subunit RPN8/RPN11
LNGKWDPVIERCGIITQTGEILETKNLSETPELTFEFEPTVLEGVLGSWHSHPTTSANLSIDDFWFFKSWPSISHFIISSDEVRCYVDFKHQIHLVHAEKDYPSRPSG